MSETPLTDQYRSATIPPLIELRNIDMTFYKPGPMFKKPDPIHVLRDISFSISEGQVVALVGESGGGKTTIGNILSGLIEPTAGVISFEGMPLGRMTADEKKEYRKSVQIVQQDSYAALNPARTIYQSLSAPLIGRKICKNKKDITAKIKESLELVELKPYEQFIDKYPHQLSGGQRQRILLARALSLTPKLIIADEPVSMIDVSLRVSVLNLISRLNREKKIAFLYITHDLATARYISKDGNIGVLYLGRLVEFGHVGDVINNPKHPYLQALISAVPIPDPEYARKQRRYTIKDVEIPNIANPPSGCSFHPRCIYAEEICAETCPQLTFTDKRLTACHKSDSIPKFEYT